MEAVAAGEPSRLPVTSLYGETFETSRRRARPRGARRARLRPAGRGSRYYTYVWTMAMAIRAGASGRFRSWCSTGRTRSAARRRGGTGRRSAPVIRRARSGAGEARNDHRRDRALDGCDAGFGCDLTVVPMRRGGRRPRAVRRRDLPWVLPSPNMPTPDTALVYPGGCLVEGTNLSEGRGTTRPFEIIGAPWLDADTPGGALAEGAPPGVHFRPLSFRPMFHKLAGRDCGGRAAARDGRRALPPLQERAPFLMA